MTTTKTRILSLAAVAALGVTLAACSDSGSTDDTTTDSADTTTTDDAGEETAEDVDETEGDDAAAGGSGPECLIGTWSMDPQSAVEELRAQLGEDVEISADGTSTVTIAEDTIASESDVTSTFSGEVEGAGTVEGESVTDGSFEMEYTADDSTITYGEVVSADGTVTSEQTINGTPANQELSFEETAGLLVGTTLDYQCSDSELTLVSSEGGVEVTQTFARS